MPLSGTAPLGWAPIICSSINQPTMLFSPSVLTMRDISIARSERNACAPCASSRAALVESFPSMTVAWRATPSMMASSVTVQWRSLTGERKWLSSGKMYWFIRIVQTQSAHLLTSPSDQAICNRCTRATISAPHPGSPTNSEILVI